MPERHDRLATSATYAVLALSMADNTTVGVAVPRIRDTFHLGVTSLQWVVAGYIVAFAGLLFTGGVIGDRYGRRRALVAGIGVFGVGAVVAATAQDWRVLIAGRVVQGLGAACSEPGTLSLLRQIHPDDNRRLRVFGGWAAASGLALAAGPVIAGLCLSAGGWRVVFVAEATAAFAAAVVGAVVLPESADPPGTRADVRGQVLVALCLVATTYALIDGQNRGFGAPPVVAAWVVAAGALADFIRVERRASRAEGSGASRAEGSGASRAEPVLDLELFRDRTTSAGLLAAAASTFALFAVLLLMSLDVEVVGGYGGLRTAGVFAPMTVAMVAAGPLGARWAARRGPARPLVGGLTLAAVACAGLDAAVVRPIPVAATIAALTALGVGFGLVVAPMVGTVLARVPARRSGMGAAAVTAAREVGGVMGVAILGAIVNGLLFTRLTHRMRNLGIPVHYRDVVIDAIRKGAPLPKQSSTSHGLIARLLGDVRQNLTDRTVDIGKGAYVDSVRSALIVAVCVLVAGAVGVALLLRHADVRDTHPPNLSEPAGNKAG